MSRIKGDECKAYLKAYESELEKNPDINGQQHEIATFVNLLNTTKKSFDKLNVLEGEAQKQLKEFAWLMWKYGFAYDYPD